MLLLVLTACRSRPEPPPTVDEVGFTVAVQAHRPDLFREDCWNTLTLAPPFRDAVLDGTDSYAAIVARDYTPSERESDLSWIRSNQAAELAFCQAHPGTRGCTHICDAACDACDPPPGKGAARESLSIEPSGYPLCAAVGYRIGQWSASKPYDPAGRVQSWKVFFEFRDGSRPSPAQMDEFSRLLLAAGYRGDWKLNATSATPEMARFQYNNLILHAYSPEDAVIAESVGLAHFAGSLAAHGRGLDVGSAPNAANVADWHHFLCEGDLGSLSDDAVRFVGFGSRPAELPKMLVPPTLSTYHREVIHGVGVLWNPALDAQPELRARVRAALDDDLSAIRLLSPDAFIGARIAVDPAPSVSVQRHEIGVHRSAEWLSSHGFDAERLGVVEVNDAERYLQQRQATPNALARSLTLALGVTSPAACEQVANELGTTCRLPQRTPPTLSTYHSEVIEGVTVLWNPALDGQSELRKRVRAALDDDLSAIHRRAPDAFTGARIAVDPAPSVSAQSHEIGVHRSPEWLSSHGFDAERLGVVEVNDAENWLQERQATPHALGRALTLALGVTSPAGCEQVAKALGTQCR